jgi:hypothetical protein
MKGTKLALLPIVILLAVLLVLLVATYPEGKATPIYEIPAPFSSAHSFFLSISSLVVAYFFARAFIGRGVLNLLLLGCASLILGSGFLASQVLGNIPFGGPLQLLGISSLVNLSAGLVFGTYALATLLGGDFEFKSTKIILGLTYAVGLLIVLLAVWLVEAGIVPPFFRPGVGPTPIRQYSYLVAIILFGLTSMVVLGKYVELRSGVLYWFSLGLAVITIGFVSAYLGKFPGGPFSWLARISVGAGGIYFLFAVREAYRLASK